VTILRNAGDGQVDLEEFIALCGGEHVFAANAARFQRTTGVKRGHDLPGAVAMAAMAPSARLDSPTGSRPLQGKRSILHWATRLLDASFLSAGTTLSRCFHVAVGGCLSLPLQGRPHPEGRRHLRPCHLPRQLHKRCLCKCARHSVLLPVYLANLLMRAMSLVQAKIEELKKKKAERERTQTADR
jgi:hypothetical protein